jgi:hypothetical protein
MIDVSTKSLMKARRSAMRVRAAKACLNCKRTKARCSGFQPCKRCANNRSQSACEFESNELEMNREAASSLPLPAIQRNFSQSNMATYSHLNTFSRHHQSIEKITSVQDGPDVSEGGVGTESLRISCFAPSSMISMKFHYNGVLGDVSSGLESTDGWTCPPKNWIDANLFNQS